MPRFFPSRVLSLSISAPPAWQCRMSLRVRFEKFHAPPPTVAQSLSGVSGWQCLCVARTGVWATAAAVVGGVISSWRCSRTGSFPMAHFAVRVFDAAPARETQTQCARPTRPPTSTPILFGSPSNNCRTTTTTTTTTTDDPFLNPGNAHCCSVAVPCSFPCSFPGA